MKYYAVKNGRKTGIYTSWEDTENLVKGYPDAKYKSFKTRKDAEVYMGDGNEETSVPSIKQTDEPEGDYAFVDGSFNADTDTYGYGGFLSANGIKYPISGSGNKPDLARMRNVAGEIEGALAAAHMALEMKLKRLTILYDYEGIEAWVNGGWKCRKEETAAYRDAMQEIIAKGLAIRFVKVRAHSGIPGNELADSLAKSAVGIGI